MNQNTLGQVISCSLKPDCKIDFEEAMKYRLAKIPPSLCLADWAKQSSSKLDFLTALDIQYSTADVIQDYQQSSFVLNVMAAIVTAGNLKAIEELTWKIVNTITAECKRVDVVAGSYQKSSWKNSTRKNRACGEEIIIKSAKNKIKDWQYFMKCSNNKIQMISNMFGYIQIAKVNILNKVRTTIMYLSQESQCCSVTLPSRNKRVEELASSHEETDYRLLTSYFFNQW